MKLKIDNNALGNPDRERRNQQRLAQADLSHVGDKLSVIPDAQVASDVFAALAGTHTIQRDTLAEGQTIVLETGGSFTCEAADSLTLRLMAGTTVLATLPPVDLDSGQADAPWRLRAIIRCGAAGSAGKVRTNMDAHFGESSITDLVARAAGVIDVTLNTIADAYALSVEAQWGTGNPGNSLSQEYLLPTIH